MLDVSVQAQILILLRDLLQDLGLSYHFITHNIGVVETIADRLVVMKSGRLVEQGACAKVLARPAHAARFAKVGLAEPLPELRGQVPRPAALKR